jgi:RNA polymerase sigma-70 factor (ECF subfamily)
VTSPNDPAHKPGSSVPHAAASSARVALGVADASDLEVGAQASMPGAEPPPLTRAELEAVRRRDPAALAKFFERHFDRIHGLISRLTGDRATAEDVTQEVFLKVHRAAHQIDPARDPTPWLTTIAYNACRDLWRSGAYRLSRRSDSIEDESGRTIELTHDHHDPERDLIAAERRRLVMEAIDRLPEALRTAVFLHDYQGLSHQEIATMTGLNHAAARKRYSRALAALGKALKETMR